MSRRKRNGKGGQNSGRPNPRDTQVKGQPGDQNGREGQLDKGSSDKPPKNEGEVGGSHNDPAWYARDPQLLIDAASIPFSNVFGAKVKGLRNAGVAFKDASISANAKSGGVPGIVVLETVPSIGNAEDFNDPVNVAAHMLYTHVRYNNSGRKNYDQADLTMYCLAISDLYSFIFWMRRLYNCAFMISQRNEYFGLNLLTAQRVSTDIVEELASFRSFINYMVAKVSSLVVPDSIELFKRRAFLYSSIYLDNAEGVIKDQMYMFNPSAFYQFKLDTTGKGMLMRLDNYTKSASITLSQIKKMGEALLKNIIGDEDFGIMSGDLMRSFPNALIGLESQPEEGVIIPIHDPLVLAQMKNATIVGGLIVNADGVGTEAAQYVNAGFLASQSIVNKDGTIPVSENNISITRLTYEIPLSVTDSTQKQTVGYGCVYQDGYGNIRCKEAVVLVANNKYWNGNAYTVEPGIAADQVMNLESNVVIASEKFDNDPAYVVEATRLVARTTDEYVEAQTDGDFTAFGMLWCGAEIVVSVNVMHTNGVNGTYPNLQVLTLIDKDYCNYRGNYRNYNFRWLQAVVQAKYMPLHHTCTYVDVNGTLTCVAEVILSDIMNYTVQDASILRRLNEIAMLSLLSVPGVSKVIN